MDASYEQMHRYTKLAQFSIGSVRFAAFLCPLSLLVLAALNLRAGACRVLPKGGPAWVSPPSSAWAWVWVGAWGGDLAEGCAGASTYVRMACTLVLWTVGRGAWSIASVKQARIRGGNDIHWANG